MTSLKETHAPSLPIDQLHNEQVLRAHEMTELDKTMKLGTVIKKYWKSVLWSMCLSTALIMEGYDIQIINSFWGNAAFLDRFGRVTDKGVKYIPANWQAAINNAALIGEIVGLAVTGYLQGRIGYKKTYLIGMVCMAAAIFLPVFANSLEMLFAGEIICGIPWGMFQTLTTAYAVEICPMALRGYLASYVNMCWGIGLTLGAGVVRGTIEIEGQWSWRLPYAIQWVWPVPLFVAVLFAPESPWFLIRKGRKEEARMSLRRLAAKTTWTEQSLDDYLALIEWTNRLEEAEIEGVSFRDCLRKSNLRRTEIACMVWSVQYTCGQPIVNYTTQFLQNAGLNEDAAFDVNLATTAMIIAGTIAGWFIMFYAGRRPIYLWGCALMSLNLGIVGIMGCLHQSSNVTWGIGALLIVLTLIFSCTVGPACYTIVAELPSTRVRAHTVILARATYLVAGVVIQQLNPRMLGVADWNWGAKAGFFYLGTNALSFVYCYFRLPETKGRTFGELDVLFFDKVPARKFKNTQVSEFDHIDRSFSYDAGLGEKGDEARIEYA